MVLQKQSKFGHCKLGRGNVLVDTQSIVYLAILKIEKKTHAHGELQWRIPFCNVHPEDKAPQTND